MKKSAPILVTAILFTIGTVAINGCGSSEEQHSEETHEHHEGAIEEHERSAGKEHSDEYAKTEEHEHSDGEVAHEHGEGKEHDHHGEDHAHKASHGGVVKTSGDYYIEMVMGEEKVTFYLLDGKENTIPNKDITGTAILQFDNHLTATEKLTAQGNDHFVMKLKNLGTSFACVVSFKVDGKTVSAKFTPTNYE